jgi:membrane protease YdiL (CAAX protease family)
LYHAFDPLAAGAIVLAAVATFYLTAAVIVPGNGFVIAQLMLATIPVVVAISRGHGLGALGIAAPRLIYVVAAMLIGMSMWYLNWRLVDIVRPPGDTKALDEVTTRTSLGAALVLIAILPPICEEIVFRGVLARSLATKLPAMAAAAITALVFSAYHLSAMQAIPTFTLGFVLSVLAIRADSIVPAVIAHALNNAVAVVIARDDVPAVDRWFDAHPTGALCACSAATGAGIALAIIGPRR